MKRRSEKKVAIYGWVKYDMKKWKTQREVKKNISEHFFALFFFWFAVKWKSERRQYTNQNIHESKGAVEFIQTLKKKQAFCIRFKPWIQYRQATVNFYRWKMSRHDNLQQMKIIIMRFILVKIVLDSMQFHLINHASANSWLIVLRKRSVQWDDTRAHKCMISPLLFIEDWECQALKWLHSLEMALAIIIW